MPYISAMITAMQNNNQSSLDENAALINGLQKPIGGDRKVAIALGSLKCVIIVTKNNIFNQLIKLRWGLRYVKLPLLQ